MRRRSAERFSLEALGPRFAPHASHSAADAAKARALGLAPRFPPLLGPDRTMDAYVAQRRPRVTNTPSAILDAPDLRDDFYLNILDWSAQGVVSLALDTAVYTYDAAAKRADVLVRPVPGAAYVTSVRSVRDGAQLAVADCGGGVALYDVRRAARLCGTHLPDAERMAALASHGALLWAGTECGAIAMFDARAGLRVLAARLVHHEREVCGLALSSDGRTLASGANDNSSALWDTRRVEKPFVVMDDHTAAVKALAWCPWQPGLLATGAGTTDRRLRFWDALSGALVRSIDTGAQICGALWAPTAAEIVTVHGYSRNDLAIWHYPTLSAVASIPAHASRILHCALSPDGTTVATSAANASLKFWRLYAKRPALRRPHARVLRALDL